MESVAGVDGYFLAHDAVQSFLSTTFERTVNEVVVNENPVFAGLHGSGRTQRFFLLYAESLCH